MKFIKNYKSLLGSASKLKKDILEILEYILNHIKPEEALKRSISLKGDSIIITDINIHLNRTKNIYVVGGGKASYRMAKALYYLLDDSIKEGVISVKEATENRIGPIKIIKAGHPLPTQEGIEASREIIRISKEAKEDDLIIALISGGGSALLPYPMEGITLSELQKTNELLISSGATINEINTVRKHLSLIKGGRLSVSAYPAKIISLIISDVVGDDISSIASGPTTPDDSTFEEANLILKRYKIYRELPSSVTENIKKGIEGKIPETPNLNDPTFQKTHNRIILNNLSALNAGKEKAEELKYNTIILSSSIEGESREVGIFHAGIAKEIESSSHPLKRPAVLFTGGETTVTLGEYIGNRGGPNQECVMGFLEKSNTTPRTVFLSIDSDGIDGNSNYAGGIVGGTPSLFNKKELIKALERHLSSRFLKEINATIKTGETGTNVNDIRILGVSR